MKPLAKFALCFFAIRCVCGCPFEALAFNSGSTGTEDLYVYSDTTIPLPEDGVLQYRNVVVQSGTLRFARNAKNTPVTILAAGSVTVSGSISVSGGSGNYIWPGAGGPGGFDGGQGGVQGKPGFHGAGPGGGGGADATVALSTSYYNYGASGGGGGYASGGGKGADCGINSAYKGGSGGSSYGNDRLLPLIGGSGGGGGGGTAKYVGGSGGGGGGAILIAASGTINVTGSIYANGGTGIDGEHRVDNYSYGNAGGSGGGGAGGAIRLVATTIKGDGVLSAVGGGSQRAYYYKYGGTGGKGRIRLEAENNLRNVSTNPPSSFGAPSAVDPVTFPSLQISAVNGVAISGATSGQFSDPDITLPFNTNNPVTVTVSGANIPPGTSITLEAKPQTGDMQSATGILAGSSSSSTANVDINISTAYPTVITAYVTVDVSVAFNRPVHVDGELVARIRIASSLGGNSGMTYILESGREVPAYM